MKRNLVIVILLACISLQMTAQKKKDVLYLKNGSIICGNLIEIKDGQFKISTSDGSLLIYQNSEVDKLISEIPAFAGRKNNGVGLAMEAGLLIGAQQSEFDAPFSFNIIVNYTHNTKSILGLGSGVEFLGSTFTPLFFEYKQLLFNRNTTPFLFLRAGKLLHLGGESDNDIMSYPQYNYPTNYKGGASLGFGTGVSWAGDESEMYLSFGYRYAQTSYSELNYNEQSVVYKNYFNRLEVKFGFKF